MAILREGISAYKAIRGELKNMVPFFPLGFNRVNNRQLAYGVRNERKAYLAVFTVDSDMAEIPLEELGRINSVRVVYPAAVDCEFALNEGKLKVRMPGNVCARLFEVSFV